MVRVALSETRMAEEGNLREISGGYAFYWKGRDEILIGEVGDGFVGKNNLVERLGEFPSGIYERLLVKERYVTLIRMYATARCGYGNDKLSFYHPLKGAYCNMHKADEVILGGDFDERVRQGSQNMG